MANIKNADKYYVQRNLNNLSKALELCKELPDYCSDFILSSEISDGTRLGYIRDISFFLHFLQESNPVLKEKKLLDITLQDLDELTAYDFDEYTRYLKKQSYNANTRNRKLAALKSLFSYLFRINRIEKNETAKILLPSSHEQPITYLNSDEVSLLLEKIKTGSAFSGKKQQCKNKTKNRDYAIISLLLYTGIRVSECVGIDLNDVNIDECSIKVHRKGNFDAIVYFSDQCRDALLSYLSERDKIIPLDGSEKAFFLSGRRSRMSVRMIETLVEEYSLATGISKHITPHKLRSTFGTNLYRETGDIYLCADALGHTSVDTTKKRYSAMTEDTKSKSRNALPY